MEGKMAELFPDPSEQLIKIDRRELLCTAAGITTAGLMPDITPSEVASAEPVQTVSTTSKAPIFSAPIFLEITRRNLTLLQTHLV